MDSENLECEKEEALLVTNTFKSFFSAIYIINLKEVSFKTLITPPLFNNQTIGITEYDKLVEIFSEKCILEDERKMAYEFLDIRTMANRLSGKQYIKKDFKTVHMGWIRACLMTSEVNEDGVLTKALFCSQVITEEKEKEIQIKEKGKRYDDLYSILCHDYDCCYYVTLDNNTALPYKVTEKIQKEYKFQPMKPMQYDWAAKMYIEKAVLPEDREALYEISDVSWLRRNLSLSRTVDRTFRVYDRDSYRYWQVRIAKTSDVEHFSMVVGFGDVDEKMREEMSQKRALEVAYEEAVQLRQGLLSDNIYLYNANLSRDLIDEDIICYTKQGEISLLKKVGIEAPCSFNEYSKRCKKFLAQEYFEAYKQIENCDVLLDAYQNGKESVSIVFGMYTLDRKKIKIVQHTCVFSISQETGDTICTCFGKDITDDIEKNAILTREHKQYRDALMAQAEFEYEFDVTEGFMTEEFVTKKGINVLKTIGVKAPIPYDEYTKIRRRAFKEKTLNDRNDKYWTRDGLIEAYNEGKRNVEFEFYSGFEDRYFRISFLLSNQSGIDHIVAIVIGRDITEERKKEENIKQKLADALYEAKKANYAKTTFLSQMSHDIRTPLNGIIGLIEIDQRHPYDIPKIQENREKSMVAAKHLLSLINDVLEISKLDAQNVKIEHEAFDIRDLISDIMTITEMRALESNIELINDNSDSDYTVPYVYGSPLHLRQIYLNILGNSIKYNKPGGTVRGKMEVVNVDKNKVVYRYTISDTGIGMSREFMNNIFDPFSQEHSDARSVYQGTGLGMTIAKRLIDKMNGTIQITSEIGVGSTFVITIPFDIAHETDLLKPKEVVENIDITGTKILLVEDNDLNLEIAEYLLKDAGAIVTCAVNGKEAVEKFENNPPGTFDVILMDVMMPVMNGYQATEEIRRSSHKDARSIPIFAMTANAFTEDKAKAKEAGMNEHLTKPLDYKTMIQKIAKYIK